MSFAVAATACQQGTRKGALCFLFACVMLATGSVRAQDGSQVADVMAAFSHGSIDSVARAEAALALVDRERIAQEARYAQARKLCYEKFLAEQCLSEARLENIRVTSRIRDVELEAKSVKRSAELRELDQARDARNREAQAEAARRREKGGEEGVRRQAERDASAAERIRKDGADEAASRAARAREVRERAAARAQARERKEQEAREGAAGRAERARRHDEMVRETLERAERRARAEEKKAADKRAAAAQTPAGR